jgi:hypothetical protein
MTVLTVLLLIPVTYWFYAAVMSFKRARDAGKMSWPMKVLAYPALFIGLALDVLLNLTVCTVLFLEVPKELLVTSRLSRHIKGSGKRAVIAKWLCSKLLDELDPSGCHCK